MKRALDQDDIVYFRFEGFEDSVEFPSATGALVNDEFGGGFEGAEGFESEDEVEFGVGGLECFVLLFEEN